MTSNRYVSSTRDRFSRPRSTKRWYQCRCGRWWGVNKSTRCVCNAARFYTSARDQAISDRVQADILDKLGHPEWAALVRGFIPRSKS